MKHTYATILLFMALSLIGGLLITRLSVQLAPSAGGRSLTVSFAWRGAAPESLERQVTARLEGVLATLSGVQKIRSVSGYNRGYITLDLDRTANTDDVRFEVAALVRQVYPRLPREVSYPQISLNTPDEETQTKPLLTLQLSGSGSPGALQRFAEEQLKPRLSAVPDVGNVAVYGGTRQQWVLTYNADALISLQLTETDLRRAVEQYVRREPLGQVQTQTGQPLRVSLANTQALAWGSIPVVNRAGRLVYLRDVVSISREEPPAGHFYRINGKTAVNVVLSAVAGANQLTVAHAMRLQLAALRLPLGYQAAVEYDTTTFIRDNLRKIGIQTGVAVLVLLLFVAVTTRNRQYVWLIANSTLVTLMLSVIAFVLLNVEIHLYSLAALTTSLGIVMDNVIVMIDHYRRYRDLRAFTALLGATLTTCAGLVVVWFLPEANRQALSDFALVMTITLFVSLLVAMAFIPSVMEQFWGLRQPEKARPYPLWSRRRSLAHRARWWEHQYSRFIGLLLRFRKTVMLTGLLLFGLPVFWLPNRLEQTNPWASYYNTVFDSDFYADNLRVPINKWLGGTVGLFVNYIHKGSYQSAPERTALYVVAELPNQSTPEQMDAVFRRFENALGQYPEIDKFITQINSGQEGVMTVYFKEPYDQSIFPFQLKSRAILLSTEMSGIDWNIFGVGRGFSQKPNDEEVTSFNVEMLGYNYRQLEEQADLLARMLQKHPRIQAVNINRSPGFFQRKSLYEYQLTTRPDLLALNRIGPTSLYEQLTTYNARPQPDLYAFLDGDYETVTIRPWQSQTVDVWTLQQQPLSVNGTTVKLSQSSAVIRQKVTPEIHKEDQQYRRVVSFEYYGGYNFGEKFLTKTLGELRGRMPLGYTAKAMDRFWFGQNARAPYELIGLVLLLIYLICAIIFESLWQPLALISLIPLSYVGVFLAFYWTDSNFDQGGYASFVLLAGNVVCAGIFVVVEMNRLRSRFPRLSAKQSYLKAFRHKIGPVLLTVLSTVVGMVPFLLYEQEPFWYALGVGTIGGLLMSLLAVVLYLPLPILRANHTRN
ncbi:efflux RND transporter permease subunit [Spirosoma flavum]|uniref:Efflux RND transporter permease subunit n=1 Tax=Spirosoma flavum TaxID=2048557 RepID=A0ABW6AT08_9BACT